MLTLLLSVALADEPAPAAVAAPPPPIAAPVAAPAAPVALTAEKLQALRSYKAQRLALRSETEVQGGGASVVGFGYPAGPAALSTAWVVSDPITTTRTWGVYRGPQRLSVPTFLGEVGALDQKKALVTEIDRAHRNSRIWFGVAGVGLAGVVAGMGGMVLADDRPTWVTFNQVSFVSTGVLVGGLFGGSFPSAKASHLSRYPIASMGAEEAQRLVDSHNEALRTRLALEPQEVWLLEMGADGN